MTGAMYAAIAGLKTHMSKMNVIGNNIANVNTAGYKTQRTIFKDAMYTTYSSGSDGTATTGGKNPGQIGYGSMVSTIDLDMHTGTFTPGRTTDCMLYGDGFFLVGDKDIAGVIDPTNPESLKSLQMTRVGDFEFKADGYLCDGNGNPVYGFMTTGVDKDGKPIVSDQLVPIRLPKMRKMYIDTQNPDDPAITQEAFDKLDPADQAKYEAKIEVLYPKADDGQGNATILQDQVGQDADGNPVEYANAWLDGITINKDTGAITGTLKDSDLPVTVGFLAIGNVTNPNGVSHEDGFYYSAKEGAGDLQVSLMNGAAEDLGINRVNGSLLGADQEGSEKMLIGSAGGTQMITGGLEGSNVDLATEISEMITTQRGYQANSRIITVTDTMLEELVNMKR